MKPWRYYGYDLDDDGRGWRASAWLSPEWIWAPCAMLFCLIYGMLYDKVYCGEKMKCLTEKKGN